MPNYKATSSRSVRPAALAACSCALLGCSLFEPESHWECFNPDCSAVDASISGGGAGGSEAGGDAGTSGASGGSAGIAGTSGAAADAGSACVKCDPGLVCNEVDGECVPCLGNDDCEPSAPVCTVDHHCVPCTLDRDCPSTAPACSDGNTCVGCTANEHCGGDTPFCDTDRHECVQCLENSDCTDPAASRCSDGTCQACTGPLHCEHLDDLGICDTSSGSGECVQCTGTQYAACGTDAVTGDRFVCDSIDRSCTDHTVASSGLCGECVSDAECPGGQLCVLQEFESATIGYFCMWQRGAGDGGAPTSCTMARPYRETVVDAESIDGATADVCTLRLSTCPAHAGFDATTCSGATPSGDAECGAADVEDGYCRALAPPDDAVFHCTTGCLSDDDCQVGSTCDTLVTPRTCTF